MAAPFIEMEKPGRTLAQRIFRRPSSRGAFAEITNLLATAPAVRDVTDEQVAEVASTHGLNVHARLRRDFEALYTRFVEYCLADKHLSEDELADLSHLKQLLGIADPDARRIHNEIAHGLYAEAVEEAVRDGRLSDDERSFLEALRERIQLPTGLATQIYERAATARVKREVDDSTADSQLSPEEDAEILAVAASLGVDLSIDDENRRALDRLRLYWTIENGDIPGVDVDINLPRSEHCYFHAPTIGWYEHRTVSRRINYSGPTARIKIAKGIYWRAGSIKAQSVSEEVLKPIDRGPLFLTNKRLIFMGARGNKNIRLNKILTFEAFSNGIDVQKDTGRSPFLAFEQDVDLASLILDRAIRDANS